MHSRQHDDGIVAERRHGFKGHIAGALDGPFVALFHEDDADEAGDREVAGLVCTGIGNG